MHTNIFVEISEGKNRLGSTAQTRENYIEQASVAVPLSTCIRETLCYESEAGYELSWLRVSVDFLSYPVYL
jgi:hypothetical protein